VGGLLLPLLEEKINPANCEVWAKGPDGPQRKRKKRILNGIGKRNCLIEHGKRGCLSCPQGKGKGKNKRRLERGWYSQFKEETSMLGGESRRGLP